MKDLHFFFLSDSITQMSDELNPKKIPTSIVFGPVGNGKSNFIQKIQHSDWLIINQNNQGCICCLGRLPLQVHLTQCLRENRNYQQVILEHAGLEHLAEVKKLIDKEFSEFLNFEKFIFVIDAKILRDHRYWQLATLKESLKFADEIIAMKQDTYEALDIKNLQNFLKENNILVKASYLSI